MPEIINKIITFFNSWNWSEIIRGIVSIWMATVATFALKTWKKQLRAQKQANFMGEISKYVHQLINTLIAPREIVRHIKIGIESHASLIQLNKNLKNPEAVYYIQKRGEEDAKHLLEYLRLCEQPLLKICSLVAEGQALGFKNYNECQNSCNLIIWQYERIQALCFIIGNPNLNWENPTVQKSLSKTISLEPDDIKKQIEEQNVKFLNFLKDNYQRII
ncbi:MAG: hypothetical protein P9M12_00025 [Candidatus Aceula lacicola]|nr:hypothetical protein [Candidatus Aceula lacicola]